MLAKASLSQVLRLIEHGKISALDYLEDCLRQLRLREPTIGAWEHLPDLDGLIDDWRRLEPAYAKSSLKGLPVGIKDTIDAVGFPAERGSLIYRGRLPDVDAACVAQLRAAGASILGKTVTTEFAYFSPGKTKNPHDAGHTPGGSSSGSAAAVAASMVPVALGSQTAASVIRPASYCGVVGFVASHGLHALRGVMPLSQSFDTLGIFARSVEDIVLTQSVLLEDESIQQYGPQRPAQVLILPGTQFGEVSTSMLQLMEAVRRQLERDGVVVRCFDELAMLNGIVDQHHQLMAFEAARTLSPERRQRPDLLSPQLVDLINSGLARSVNDSVRLKTALNEIEHGLSQAVGHHTLILTPAAPGAAVKSSVGTGKPYMSRPWQALGRPAITLPVARDEQGFPLGLQIVADRGQDLWLLATASWLEHALCHTVA